MAADHSADLVILESGRELERHGGVVKHVLAESPIPVMLVSADG